MHESISLAKLNRIIAERIISSPLTQNVWVTAELSDVAVRNRHCYMELLEKDANGVQIAKARGVIWANRYTELNRKLLSATGQSISSGIKLLVQVSVNMHPVYGMSMVISDLDPDYTMGDLLRRRRENIEKLKLAGVLDLNRNLEWPDIVQRIAIISAPGAAGYGDFCNQLLNNPSRLRFEPRLFPAVMQGESAPASIINALEAIANDDWWDCVVIIRGGGATSDLQCFEDYDLAYNIACFDIPVIIGIGHERDITLLDSVANMRVKTPTAAAEWLIERGDRALAALDTIAQTIFTRANGIVTGCKEQLSYYQGLLPIAPFDATRRASLRLSKAVMLLSGISSRRLIPAMSQLDVMATNLATAATTAVKRANDRLDNATSLLDALSPQAVLNRGYSITRIDGHAVTSTDQIKPGDTIETTLANGTITSIIK
ncbi:MAG: exodeoxyribonuclease VII large subunit [Muribaculaceae bacterium]|nr:exodeoxyribonuclease VII large subunit [Muribaculaceae bacterium]